MLRKREGTAAVTLRNSQGGELVGIGPKTQLFGPAFAVPYYDSFLMLVAPVAFRVLRLPCVRYVDDCDVVAELNVFPEYLPASAGLSDVPKLQSKIRKSEAGEHLDFLGELSRPPKWGPRKYCQDVHFAETRSYLSP